MTTTDLAHTAPAPPLPAIGSMTSDAMQRLGEWVTAASQAHALVGPLVDSAFVPDAYKPRVDPRASAEDKADARQVAVANATAAVLLGLTLGIDPMTALQQIYIVKGRPGMYTKMKVALLQSRGYEVWTESLTDAHATVCGTRPGSDRIEKITITMDMARKAGWLTNDAYSKTPQDMLWARAAGRVCDRIGPEVLMGLPTVEEIPDTPMQVEATVGVKVTADDIIQATVSAPPTAEPATPVEPERVETGPPPTAMRRMFALLKERGLTDKVEALAFICQTIGRDIASRSELTRGEVAAVIDALEPAPEPPTDVDGEQP